MAKWGEKQTVNEKRRVSVLEDGSIELVQAEREKEKKLLNKKVTILRLEGKRWHHEK